MPIKTSTIKWRAEINEIQAKKITEKKINKSNIGSFRSRNKSNTSAPTSQAKQENKDFLKFIFRNKKLVVKYWIMDIKIIIKNIMNNKKILTSFRIWY